MRMYVGYGREQMLPVFWPWAEGSYIQGYPYIWGTQQYQLRKNIYLLSGLLTFKMYWTKPQIFYHNKIVLQNHFELTSMRERSRCMIVVRRSYASKIETDDWRVTPTTPTEVIPKLLMRLFILQRKAKFEKNIYVNLIFIIQIFKNYMTRDYNNKSNAF